ncbi:hypothetical protein NDU88_005992 [Pleurodeles waltl]|uniref:Uncharacterized protein n=1 Tax=Pleurodeles waltl TaxID=8319 RepID=A0AAV7WEA4_PLEWA|nr:hypothetical protein NDU88_005992 [Pleurodeles waltl]
MAVFTPAWPCGHDLQPGTVSLRAAIPERRMEGHEVKKSEFLSNLQRLVQHIHPFLALRLAGDTITRASTLRLYTAIVDHSAIPAGQQWSDEQELNSDAALELYLYLHRGGSCLLPECSTDIFKGWERACTGLTWASLYCPPALKSDTVALRCPVRCPRMPGSRGRPALVAASPVL